MGRLADARRDARLFFAMRTRALNRPDEPSPENAADQIRADLATRQQRFLDMMDRCVWSNPASPYLPLLKAAGCEPGDVRALVRRDGLEPSLARLKNEGVYVTFEQFKGRAGPSAVDFDNPHVDRRVAQTTGGSTGPATEIRLSVGDNERWRGTRIFAQSIHGTHRVAHGDWAPPRVLSLMRSMRRRDWPHPRRVRFLKRVERRPADILAFSVTSRAVKIAAALSGLTVQKQVWTDPRDALPIVRWARAQADERGACLISCTVSDAVRIANTAVEHGIDLRGVAIGGISEPATPAKVRQIMASGAHWSSAYALAEMGVVGYGCASPVNGSDVHFCSDRFALVQAPREVPGTGLQVDAFYFTTLSDLASKVMLNTEVDDFGVVEQRECGCPLGDVGFDRHIRDIFSFAKLTGEGVTLVGNDVVRVLEEVLPARFGGTSLDYQLVEEEDENGMTRLSLVIDPSVRIEDETEVIEAFVSELKGMDAPSSMGGAIWAQSQTFRIKRATPVITGVRGKFLPLHVSQRTQVT